MYCRTGPREIRVRTPCAYAQQGVGGDQGREATNDRVCDRTDGKVSSIWQSPHLFLQPYFCRVFGTLARTEMLLYVPVHDCIVTEEYRNCEHEL
jgi:hypothetical protein